MSSALSSELRTRYREYIEEGLSGCAAAARLKLSAATGVRWQRRWRKTGLIEPDVQGRQPGHGMHKCSIPDDHISPRRSALFMARSVLRDIRDEVRPC
jgi:hypothetical protein